MKGETRKQKREKQKEINFFGEFIRIKNHFFKDINSRLKGVKDKRHQSYIEYTPDIILFSMIMKNITSIESMNQMTVEFNSEKCINNVSKVLGYEDLDELPHHDTINDFLKKLNPCEIEKIRKYMIKELFKKRCLEDYRLLDKYWTIAVDATGIVSFSDRHCEHCLKREYKNKETGEVENTVYFHYVLEAKLVVGDMVFSIDTEFIENEKNYEKQDCELKAFKRLAARLKKNYKRLPICVLGDSLYAVDPVFKLCKEYNWQYILTFKEGRTKSIWSEFEGLKGLENNNNSKGCTWVNEITYKDNLVNILEAKLVENGVEKEFTFITNITIKEKNADKILYAGRSRWKIENEGFNNQKNIKNNIEHLCCKDYNAMKNHYLLVQIADILRQLFECGYELIRSLRASIKEISSRILESFRRDSLTPEDIANSNKRMQIRCL
ncbi:transposase family protein [Schnuerera sp.]|uniref:transposase family protein n=1 Tax=Schnuerera sp. TaxID=2794844 RepID=UPI002C489AC3|nr:transposase family protein [Schnuerera sp.]HSH35515.1 transposase family protein [Schnuerera sp.]